MATDVTIGYGTKYRVWDAGATPSAALVELGEVVSVTPPEQAGDRVEATHMASPNRRREYVAGLIDPGEASVELNWVPGSDTDELIRSLLDSGESVQHQIEFPNGVTVSFDAVITGYSKAVPIDDRMTATVTVSVSGDETWGASS